MRKSSERPQPRRRRSNEDRRAPFAEAIPRPVKRAAGRTPAPMVPANIRVDGVELEPELRDRIRRKLGAKLGKFAADIERVSVRLRDVNGPKGGVDHRCAIKVVLSGLPSVVVGDQAATVEAAFGSALDSAERAVRRSVGRRRSKPLKAAKAR